VHVNKYVGPAVRPGHNFLIISRFGVVWGYSDQTKQGMQGAIGTIDEGAELQNRETQGRP